MVLAPNGNIVRYNRFLEELSGYPLSDVIGTCWFSTFLPEEDQSWVRSVFNRTIQFSESRGVLNPIRTRFGRLRQIRWSNTLLRDPAGQIQSVLSIGLDVTDLVDAQQRALQSERLATIGQTMAALAHESRNALQRIQAGVELLELDLGTNSQGLDDLRRIEKAAIDLRGLLEEVRSYAAPIQLDRAECSLGTVWRRAWESLEPERKSRDAKLIEKQRHKSSTDIASVDATRLQQVFRNLFENSLAVTPDPVRIDIACRTVGHQIVLQIRDNGPGISAEQQPHLFQPFYTTRPSGTGLGLAIAQRIVEAHEGSIVCVPHPASGAEFEIVLPLSQHPPSRHVSPVSINT
ncbi:MAG: PAS domain-containing sensor histidine kinase [Planctomycetota bacterium]|nr:PAS domain-containing sensor histidine kinase [Planctomycetota bacterium]MDA1177173.1 PAS domain-containing sensor histidine kinase [Planctomycetota bacterium]